MVTMWQRSRSRHHCRAVTSRTSQDNAGGIGHPDDAVSAWARSGAMALTGRPGALPLGPPDGMVAKLSTIAELASARARALGGRLEVDPLELLGERAAIAGLQRGGAVSCGGVSRLLEARSAWFAATLARDEDVELVPAWLEVDELGPDVWAGIASAASTREAEELVERASLLGLPVALLPPGRPADVDRPEEPAGLPIERVGIPGPPAAAGPLGGCVVVDLTALWAGPLCGSLLATAGATVIKVESVHRPDGTRRGPTAFFDLLNGGKRSVAVDLHTTEGIATVRELLSRADVVLEASRPRALERLGIEPAEILASGTPRVWASITGHGRMGPGRNRVAFGDDAAVSGGLVSWDSAGPCFCADAVADPATGLVAAAAVLDTLTRGGRWLLDISMEQVAAHLAGSTLATHGGEQVLAPRARTPSGPGPRLGEHTAAVIGELRSGSSLGRPFDSHRRTA
jgi:CoA-transferase family III